jgi:hypothetical protein
MQVQENSKGGGARRAIGGQWVAIVCAGLALLSGIGGATGDRTARALTSLDFPQHRLTSDTGDILSDYADYLNFVLAIGKTTNPREASLLAHKYEQLRKADPELAARFLRGLRFEMVQKLEFVGGTSARITTDTPFMRRWVAKFLRDWLREVDEYQYRAYSARIAKRN